MSPLPPPETLAVFVVAAVTLILTPGPDTLFVLTQGATDRGRGVRAALGVATGVCLHTALVAVGLAALLRTVPATFTALKVAGAGYLLLLGVRTAREEPVDGPGTQADAAPAGYRRGVVVNALNPKVALFFLAFLPGFTSTATGVAALGSIYAALTAGYLTLVAVFAGRLGGFLRSRGRARWLQYAAALALVGLAFVLFAGV